MKSNQYSAAAVSYSLKFSFFVSRCNLEKRNEINMAIIKLEYFSWQECFTQIHCNESYLNVVVWPYILYLPQLPFSLVTRVDPSGTWNPLGSVFFQSYKMYSSSRTPLLPFNRFQSLSTQAFSLYCWP